MPKIRTEPPPSLLPKREVEICDRFRKIRLEHRLKLDHFARALGISLARLKSYEYCRAPIRFGLALELCNNFDVNQRWLATGKDPKNPVLALGISPHLIPSSFLFSFAYDRVLDDEVEKSLALLESLPDPEDINNGIVSIPTAGDPRTRTQQWLAVMISFYFKQKTDGLKPFEIIRIIDSLEKIIGPLSKNHRFVVDRLLSSQEWSEPRELTLEKIQEKLGISRDEYRRMQERSDYEDDVNQDAPPLLNSEDSLLTKTEISRTSVVPYETHHHPGTEMHIDEIPQRLIRARKKAGLTQAAAAEKWGISIGTLRDWEQGRSRPQRHKEALVKEILQDS